MENSDEIFINKLQINIEINDFKNPDMKLISYPGQVRLRPGMAVEDARLHCENCTISSNPK